MGATEVPSPRKILAGKVPKQTAKKCNCGLQKHPLRCANLTFCDLEFRLQNYHKSQTVRLMRLIHVSLSGILQVTFL